MGHGESKGKTECTQEVYVGARGFGSRVMGDQATFATFNIIRSPRSRAGSGRLGDVPKNITFLPYGGIPRNTPM
jgi:hypothetical protein